MTDLYSKITQIYPELGQADFALNSGTIYLKNVGDARGDFIAEWNHPTLARPTDEQLEAIE